MKELLRIGEVARQTGVSVDTIRHYERKGVLDSVARDESRYRRYGVETIHRVRVVRRALSLGFTLDDLGRIFRKRAAGQPPCTQVRDLASRKLAELDERIAAALAVRAALAETVASWEQKLQATPDGAFAELLESLIH